MGEDQFISKEDLDTVDSIYSDLLETEDISNLGDVEKTVYLVESYNMEINSGLDFIQWYRWSEPNHLVETPVALKKIGLNNSYEICIKAISITFPDGLPDNKDEKDKILDSLEEEEDMGSIRHKLVALAEQQENQNYILTTELASWIRACRK